MTNVIKNLEQKSNNIEENKYLPNPGTKWTREDDLRRQAFARALANKPMGIPELMSSSVADEFQEASNRRRRQKIN